MEVFLGGRYLYYRYPTVTHCVPSVAVQGIPYLTLSCHMKKSICRTSLKLMDRDGDTHFMGQ